MPCASVTAERTPSISAGLAASTVTPGSTPPEASRTTPVMLLCAHAAAGIRRHAATITARISVPSRIRILRERSTIGPDHAPSLLEHVEDQNLVRRLHHLKGTGFVHHH